MAPELIQELPYNHTADLWSLGLVFHFSLIAQGWFCTNCSLVCLHSTRTTSILSSISSWRIPSNFRRTSVMTSEHSSRGCSTKIQLNGWLGLILPITPSFVKLRKKSMLLHPTNPSDDARPSFDSTSFPLTSNSSIRNKRMSRPAPTLKTMFRIPTELLPPSMLVCNVVLDQTDHFRRQNNNTNCYNKKKDRKSLRNLPSLHRMMMHEMSSWMASHHRDILIRSRTRYF